MWLNGTILSVNIQSNNLVRIDSTIHINAGSWHYVLYIVLLLLFIRSPYGVVPNNTAPDPNEPPENHILLFTIFNPLYPITVVR